MSSDPDELERRAVERGLVSDRLGRIEGHLQDLGGGVKRLVALEEARDTREAHQLDAAAERTRLELEERKAWRGWFQDKVGDRVVGGLVAVLMAIATFIAGWWGGGGTP